MTRTTSRRDWKRASLLWSAKDAGAREDAAGAAEVELEPEVTFVVGDVAAGG